ncbi:ABC transporter permease [Nakamurella sp. YIM 132087]|uniref:ABC transporter permease n=1 Tax=Nakamurella alba TaxID=2665158 RepID=A0A7K1FGH5_9ACTN|nr:ABC transporter permease [Nakamurella alba]MTD13217.1 ABC transporter permease [Nakamurella alba]
MTAIDDGHVGTSDEADRDVAARSLTARLDRQSRRKTAWFCAVLGIGVLVLGFTAGGLSTRLAVGNGSVNSLPIGAPVWVFGVVAGLVCLVSAVVVFRQDGTGGRRAGRLRGGLLALSVFAAIVGVVAWAARGEQASLSGILALSVTASIPIILGSTSGVLAERAGTFNIAIEGQMLIGAFLSALVSSITGSAWIGVATAILGGLAWGCLLGVLTIRYAVSQVVAGFVLVGLAAGLTAFLTEQVMVPDLATFNSPETLGTLTIPLLSDIPVIGPALFRQSPLFYVAVLIAVVTQIVLYRTRTGLRIRAVGENPAAVESSGVQPRRIRFWATAASGAIGGVGGAAFTVGSAGQFVAGMSSGLGFVALAAVILGSWRVPQAAASALLFGFATSISGVFGLLKVDIPPALMLTAPYVITILVVSGVVAKGKGPAAAGGSI